MAFEGVPTTRQVLEGAGQTPEGDRCVDLSWRPDDTFGFEELRRAMAVAKDGVLWLDRLLDH